MPLSSSQSQTPAHQVISERQMLWSTHIDLGVDILRQDPDTTGPAALTHFCSAGIPLLGSIPAAPPRIREGKRFVYAFHNHTLPGGGRHWTMSWIDIVAGSASHFDSLSDGPTAPPSTASLQGERMRRFDEARATMEDWLSGTRADLRLANDGAGCSYMAGRREMQRDSWSSGLQVLETLRVILLAGGCMPALDELDPATHRLTRQALADWKRRFREHVQ